MDIALIETTLEWENVAANFRHMEKIFSSGKGNNYDVIVLPEMFSTGFTMNPEKFSPAQLEEVPRWMQHQASQMNCLLAGSSVAFSDDSYYNRFYFAYPNGEIEYYDKHHLFRMGEEQKHYRAGKERKIFRYDDWRICPQVCYDLRFPVWSRNREDYDLLIYVANWPGVRQDAWTTLLKARAIENQCYVAGVNRIGEDPAMAYEGGSVVYSPKGEVISGVSSGHSSVLSATLDPENLKAFREKFPAWMDRDPFELQKYFFVSS